MLKMESYRAPGGSGWGNFAQADTGGAAAGAGAGLAPGGFVKRRLSDRIEQAFEQACDQGQVEVAACMLKGLDLALLGRPTQWERRQAALALLRACANRLEALRTTQAKDAVPEDTLAVTAA
jgi:hypothetical protein